MDFFPLGSIRAHVNEPFCPLLRMRIRVKSGNARIDAFHSTCIVFCALLFLMFSPLRLLVPDILAKPLMALMRFEQRLGCTPLTA